MILNIRTIRNSAIDEIKREKLLPPFRLSFPISFFLSSLIFLFFILILEHFILPFISLLLSFRPTSLHPNPFSPFLSIFSFSSFLSIFPLSFYTCKYCFVGLQSLLPHRPFLFSILKLRVESTFEIKDS